MSGIYARKAGKAAPIVGLITKLNAGRVNAQTGTTYTLTAEDHNTVVSLTNAATITLTVNSDVMVAGFNCLVIQGGAGKINFAGTATRRNPYGATAGVAMQYGRASLVCRVAGEVNISGDVI